MAKKRTVEEGEGSAEQLSMEEYCTKPEFDQDGVQASAGIGPDGKEYGDPVPMSPPVGYTPPPDLLSMIRAMVKHELVNRAIEESGLETFEEADDFEIEDDPLDPLTEYERIFEPVPPPAVGPQPPSASPPVVNAGTAEGSGAGGSQITPPRPRSL